MTDIDAEMIAHGLWADTRTLATAPADKLVKVLTQLEETQDLLALAIQRAEQQIERDMMA
jgi:hypothetical protein